MNIALISLYGIENTGVRSISSVLKQNGFNVYIIFFKRWFNNDISLPAEKEKNVLTSLLRDLKIDAVGLSFTSPFLKIAGEISSKIKDELGIKIIFGGVHATVLPAQCLEYCDFVIRGEGEPAMLDLLNALKNDSPYRGINNICYKIESNVISEKMRPLIQDLDSLPFCDYGGENKFFVEKKLENTDPLVNVRKLRIFASRGCPFNCSYCYNSILRNLYPGENYHRIRSVERVIAEIESALVIFKKIKRIVFDDDTFVFPRKWIDEFCDKYKNRIGLPFDILFNAEVLEEDILEKLKWAGLDRLQVGIQTGSAQEAKSIYNRILGAEKIRQFAFAADRLKLDVVYDVILDNPVTSFDAKKELIYFLLSLPRPFDLFLYSLTIFPGTELCNIFLSKGIIKPKDVEGEADKSFRQFRLSFSYPRSKQEQFIAAVISLTSKSFLPRFFIKQLADSRFLLKHPLPVKYFAQICNIVKLFFIMVKIMRQGELNFWKFKEYGLPKRYLIQ